MTYGGCGKYSKQDVDERASRWDEIEDDGETLIREKLSTQSGWWPALNIYWQGMAEAHGLSRIEYFKLVTAGKLPIYVLCWYQLADGIGLVVRTPSSSCGRTCLV